MPNPQQSAELLGSSASDDWGTDPAVFAKLDAEFHFTLDVNADVTNAKCPLYYTKEQDALKQRWAPHTCYCNPPFTLNYEFVQYGKQQANAGAKVVFLIPARVNVTWFHDFMWDSVLHRPQRGVSIRFLRGRVPYIGTAQGGAPFPVMIVVFERGLPL